MLNIGEMTSFWRQWIQILYNFVLWFWHASTQIMDKTISVQHCIWADDKTNGIKKYYSYFPEKMWLFII